MRRLKNLRKIVIPFWRSGHRVEATSSPGWRPHRRASRPNFSSGHLYVGSSSLACPPHSPKSNSQSSLPPENLLFPQSFPLKEQSLHPPVAQASTPGVVWKPRFPRSPRPNHQPVTRAPRPHDFSPPRSPLRASIASSCCSDPVTAVPDLSLPATPWNLCPAQPAQ